jgi:LETM1 and EF-hand domain-containing protein 1
VDVETGLPAKASKSEKKLTLWEKVKKEAAHYRDGTKLLIFEVKLSFRLALKMAAGHELTRREWRQFKRTVQDLLRLVPFSAFVIVPFAELLLPVALKIFPNMLPSTYEGAKAKEAKAQKLTTTREGVSGFLRKTIQESGLPLSASTKQREEFVAFFKKVRSSAVSPTHEDIVKVCRIFKDDLTLDNLSRPQLIAMCRYMNLSSFGTDTLLRYNIRHRMRQIKRDDKAIAYEGVPTLSVPELHAACQSRGIRTQGASPGHLRDELKQWLDLRLKHRVPSTLLILSNAFSYGHNDGKPESFYDALVATLSSLPEELYHEAELEVSSLEGHATNKQRLDVLKEQADLIAEEAEQDKESKTRVSDREDLDKEDEQEPPVAETENKTEGAVKKTK